jgi:hypothetical protein
LRKVAAAALAIPILGPLYLRALLAHRRGLGIAATLLIVVALLGVGLLGMPPATTANPPGPRIDSLPALEFATEIRASESPSAPVTISFPAPMNEASVAASLSVTPSTAVRLTWDDTSTMLTISPREAWAPATYHTITVAAGALEASGAPTASPARAAFLTRPATAATIEASRTVLGEALVESQIIVTFERPVDEATLALTIEPGIAGTFAPASDADVATTSFRFTPSRPLAPDTTYRIAVEPGVRDIDGAPVAISPVELRTAGVPTVVRFRPRADTIGVSRSQVLSVRFTEAMDHASTEAAWSATIGGTTLAGTFAWAEDDTVLVFQPTSAFDYSQQVVMAVAATATSRAGVALSPAANATFTTLPKPRAGSVYISAPSVGSGAWAAVEGFYLGLLNCTRQGGWVTSTGTCSNPGGSGLSALVLHGGISDQVARPYAKLLADRGLCSHFADGSPRDRLARAGYSGDYRENLGCRSGDPFSAVLGSHLFFQAEKPCSGLCHYNNIMSPTMRYVGIGVWVTSGRVRLVCDFWEG